MENSLSLIVLEEMTMSKSDELAVRIGDGNDVLPELPGNFTVKEVSRVIAGLLRHTDERYFHAATLLRDLILLTDESSGSVGIEFRESYLRGEQQAIVDQLEKHVLGNAIKVRPWAIYTLGKIYSKSSLPKMESDLTIALGRFPDVVADLASEILWLHESSSERRRVLDLLVTSESYFNRWAAVDVIDAASDDYEDLFNVLREDSHPYVRHSASQSGGEGNSRSNLAWVVSAFRPTQSSGNYSMATFEAFVDAYMAKHARKAHREAIRLRTAE